MELASLVDPKAAALSIVSQMDKAQTGPLATPPAKKTNGPAETGSLLKHKEMLNSKVNWSSTNLLTQTHRFSTKQKLLNRTKPINKAIHMLDSVTVTLTPRTHPLAPTKTYRCAMSIRLPPKKTQFFQL